MKHFAAAVAQLARCATSPSLRRATTEAEREMVEFDRALAEIAMVAREGKTTLSSPRPRSTEPGSARSSDLRPLHGLR